MLRAARLALLLCAAVLCRAAACEGGRPRRGMTQAPNEIVPGDPVLISAPLALSEKPPAPCPPFSAAPQDLDPATLMPRAGWRQVFELRTLPGNTRNYSCSEAGVPVMNDILGSGNLTGSYDAVFENTAEGIPSVRLFRQGSASEPQDYLGTIYLEPGLATTFPSPAGPANAPWALQKVFVIRGPGVPYVSQRTRIETAGGQPPAVCPVPGAWVTVPFDAVYGYWTCAP